MKTSHLKNQSGYVLLLTVLALMGIGGVVASAFTHEVKKQAEDDRFLHNARVLKEAKQALLMYAYRYPEIALAFGTPTIRGPGRLPCPDTDDSTTPNPVADCESGPNGIVGRFPWNADGMEFYDARDASDERLWYAVSKNFANFDPSDVINSDTLGTISIHDQTGSLLYDSAVEGVVAVIIAPGPAIDRGGVMQDRAADPYDPLNYLDLYGALDNADFVNDSTNGFVLGPVENMTTGTTLVNDQIILITIEELVAVAEKATLQAYQRAMQVYSDRLESDVAAAPAPWDRYYPWLYNYAVNDLDSYPSDAVFFNPDAPPNSEREFFLSNIGRVPSIYTDYFSEANSQPIESELDVDFTLIYPTTPTTVGFDQVTPVATTGTIQFNEVAPSIPPEHVFSGITTLPQTISFSDITPDVVGQDGRITVTAITNQTYQAELWFWDEGAGPPLGGPTGVWTLCPAGGDSLSDCNRDAAGNPTPGSPNNLGTVEVLRVIAEIDFPIGLCPGPGCVEFDMNYTNAPTVTATSAANGTGHARIQGLYLGADVINVPVTLRYEIDRIYLNSFDPLLSGETGTLIASDLSSGDLTLGLRYYPELPAWIFANDWHNSMQMAYALNYRPDQPPSNCSASVDCLQIENQGGINDDKISILAIAGEHDWDDNGADGFFNDVVDVFDPENANIDLVFDIRAVNGNDRILVIDEL